MQNQLAHQHAPHRQPFFGPRVTPWIPQQVFGSKCSKPNHPISWNHRFHLDNPEGCQHWSTLKLWLLSGLSKIMVQKKYMNLPTFPISSWQFSGRSRGQIDAVFSSFACTVGLGTFAPAYLPMHLGSDPKVICHLSRHLPAIKDGNGQSQHVCRWLSH